MLTQVVKLLIEREQAFSLYLAAEDRVTAAIRAARHDLDRRIREAEHAIDPLGSFARTVQTFVEKLDSQKRQFERALNAVESRHEAKKQSATKGFNGAFAGR
jgi:SMC interacting uncharacterized protein involved in chromosome segregation